ncbi:uncharacterized protein LOC127278859 [Leptopilina boulardi]|uniref:uncharacterized protein LOC127278859 n=1 Tax=Leptopilina boulardi TaxID=63433 RepID=UPI0021F589AF|nr:uncharacterized protein LOC127278859 [Leptopilina boulardi]
MDLQNQLQTIQFLIMEYNRTSMLPFARESVLRKIRNLWELYIRCKRATRLRNFIPSVRRFWVRPIFSAERRYQQGDSDNLLKELREDEDHEKYFTYLRVLPNIFEQLHELVQPIIEKQQVVRDPICSRTRLEITLRYLCTGDSMVSLSFAFRVAHNTISLIVRETCQAIYDCLKDDYFLQPSEENWKKISDDFISLWNFDNCLGAIDGKQVEIQAPGNSGSLYFNYKEDFGVNLMAVCDAKARFLVIDVGGEGRRSENGVLRSSKFYNRLVNDDLFIPPPKALGNDGPVAPYIFVGDEAFTGFNRVLIPYPRRDNLNNKMKVFNYRLSRARRIVECAFGILATRWRIFLRKINASVPTIKKIILASVALHNFILSLEENAPENERPYQTLRSEDNIANGAFRNIERNVNADQENSVQAREIFSDYFYDKGAVEWQWEKVLKNNF